MKKKIVVMMIGAMTCSFILTACGTTSEKYVSSSNIMDGVNSISGYMADDTYGMVECIDSPDFNTEEYDFIEENGFVKVADTPLSTFAADVDTGCYCNLRRMINTGVDLENIADAIRTEEMINYFDYDVKDSGNIFSVKAELSTCPWNEDNGLLIMTVKADDDVNIPNNGNNFVFLIDTSGSMDDSYKIDMAIKSFKLLASTINENDRVSVVTYSGTSDTILEGSNDYKEICEALDEAKAYCKEYGGGTNGSGGIEAAYECAEKNFIKDGNNRVIIASDGDMNLGVTSESGLTDLITEKKESGVFLTVLGYGTGNYSDANMESIADAGNGNYYYIDNIDEAERVLVDKLKETTVTVAKDVKFQAEFNPAVVDSYRQIGYENRQMSASDFSDDTKDGGEVGAGQCVTVVYEIAYADENSDTSNLKYQTSELSDEALTGDLLTLSVRYKDPDKDTSNLLSYAINSDNTCATDDFDFIASLIETSMIIRDSDYIGDSTYDSAYSLALSGAGDDEMRQEFADLLKSLGAKKVAKGVIYADRHEAKIEPEAVFSENESDSDDTKGEPVEDINYDEIVDYTVHYDSINSLIEALDDIDDVTILSVQKHDGIINLEVEITDKNVSESFINDVCDKFVGDDNFTGMELVEE